MSLTGNMKSGGTLKGKINGLKTIHGYSAYEVAVINGFDGTEQEWLDSLEGRQGEQGVSPTAEVTAITGGYRVTITDEGGRNTFDLLHGIQSRYDARTQTLYIEGGDEGADMYSLDESLTVKGAAADAKAVGDKIAEILDDIGEGGIGGVGIQSIAQTTTATSSNGINKITITKTDGSKSVFQVRNGGKGDKGDPGNDGLGVASIWYDKTTKDFVWKDTLLYEHHFSGPDVYTKDEIGAMLGSYVDDIANIVGGDA